MAGTARRMLAATLMLLAGCSIGPKALEINRLRYNIAVKTTTEEQLLLNLVRLRYTDNPSSLAVSSIASQHELSKSFKAIPLLAASGDAIPRPFSRILPQAELTASDRPTLSLTPQDDQDFSRRLIAPLPLEGIAYLSRTTWPISTVFRMWLENMNWVSNAETASGPTPKTAPDYAEFLRGMELLQRLQDRKAVAFYSDQDEEVAGAGLPADRITAAALVDAARHGYEYRQDKGGTWSLVKKKQQGELRVNPAQLADPELLEFCRIFRLKLGVTSYAIVTEKIDPYLTQAPPEGLTEIDLETRSLIQVLYFLAHGVHVPPSHLASGLAPVTLESDGSLFDWDQVLGGLFKVCWARGRHRPEHAFVAVHYAGYWFYIDERDRDSKATFSLLLQMSQVELKKEAGAAPVLTLPVGGS
jgi:hypothetical protein